MTNYPFWMLNPEARQIVNVEFQKSFRGEGDAQARKRYYVDAISVMKGSKEARALEPPAQQILKSLNDLAVKMVNGPQYVEAWQNKLNDIHDITSYLKCAAGVSLNSTAIPIGVALLYLRSHKVLALASACAACALFVVRSMCVNLSSAFEAHAQNIEELSWQNYDLLPEKIKQTYEKLKKTGYLMHCYFEAQERRTDSDYKGLQLLKEQLAAFSHIKKVFTTLTLRLFFSLAPPITPDSDNADSADLTQIHAFFVKFEALCRKGLIGTLGIGMIALGVSYYAYVQKARLMVLAGMVYFLGSLVISRELFVLQKGSRNIHLAKGVEINRKFQEMESKSFLLKGVWMQNASNSEIQKVVVIPFDAILHLIPSWKSEVPVL